MTQNIKNSEILSSDQETLPISGQVLKKEISTDEYSVFRGYLKENEETLIIPNSNQCLSKVSIISGKLGGAWVNRGIPIQAGVFVFPKNEKEKHIDFQLQIFDDYHVKGVKARLSQQNNDIVARIIWAKSSKMLELFSKDWDSDEYNKNLNEERIAESYMSAGYGICEIVLKGIYLSGC